MAGVSTRHPLLPGNDCQPGPLVRTHRRAQGDSVALMWARLIEKVMNALGAWVVWCEGTYLVFAAVKWQGRTRGFRVEWIGRIHRFDELAETLVDDQGVP